MENNIFVVFPQRHKLYPKINTIPVRMLENEAAFPIVLPDAATSVDAAANYSAARMCCLSGKKRDCHARLPSSGHVISLKEIVWLHMWVCLW